MSIVFQTYLNQFINYISTEKHYSNHTEVSYKNDIRQFLNYISDTYGINKIDEIKHLHIRSWIAEMAENNMSAVTLARKKSALQSFFKFMLRNGIVKSNPAKLVSLPKKPKRLTTTLEPEAVKTLTELESFFTNPIKDWQGLNQMIIVLTLFETGIRRAELIGIKWSDIDISSKKLKVIGKGNKIRFEFLSDELIEWFKKYHEYKNQIFENANQETFFVTPKGDKIYPKYVYRIVKSLLQKISKVSKKSPHVLRHTFATELINNGADISAIKELMGHASLSATQIYTHLSIESLKKQYRNSHPRS